MASCIFVTGGVISSLGKGIAAASIGLMLKSRGVSVAVLKLDPYLNVDPGTMSPFQHGEVFVTMDGSETDLDLGHYERFMDVELNANSNMTAGQIYRDLIERERSGHYLGGTIQTVPHVTDKIKEHVRLVMKESGADVVLVEVGGTVGDIEGQPFWEAIRQMRQDPQVDATCYVHLTLLPAINNGELKTKPTQHSVQLLRSMGIQPNLILCRAEAEVPEEARRKIALHADVPLEGVIGLPTMGNIYEVPLYLERQGVGNMITKLLRIRKNTPRMGSWRRAVMRSNAETRELLIAVVGKYVDLPDAYISVVEALRHAAAANRRRLKLEWVSSDSIEEDGPERLLEGAAGVLVPGGFDKRGVEGMIMAARHAREHKLPYLGLCLGMQVMVIEFARNVLALADANSSEFDANTPHPVIHLMPEQSGVKDVGGTMRLGGWNCRIEAGSQAQSIYQRDAVRERHRHRYELNDAYRERLLEGGLAVSGVSDPRGLAEICELREHPFMVGCQFHPEFGSRPDNPHPLFKHFLSHASRTLRKGDQLALGQRA